MITTDLTTIAPPQPGARGGRAAWVAAGSVFAVLALVYGTYTVVGLLAFAKAGTHVAYDAVAAAGVVHVDVRNGSGHTTIVGTDGDEIVVDADLTYGLWKPSNETRIEGDTLVVRSSCSAFANTWCGVDYTISVPRGVSVLARGSGGGLTIEGVDGSIDASSSGGGVRVVDAGGTLHLRSSGGGVRGERLRAQIVDAGSSGGGVRLSFVEPPRRVDAGSSGGGVTIEVPSPYAFAIHANSSGGGVDTSEVRHDPASDRTIHVSSSGGGVTVRYLAG
jgi:hypothetical protein